MKGIKHLTAKRRRDVRSWFYSGRVAVELDGGTWNVDFLHPQCSGF
jgi:hypothetical protein